MSTAKDENPPFSKGARVRFNELGAARSPRMSIHMGTVVKTASGNKVRVIFDGSMTIVTIHRSYLEMFTEQAHRSE